MTQQIDGAMLKKALNVARRHGMGAAEAMLPAFGIQYVECAGREITYINMGDTYTPTICLENDKPFISSWGDWYETVEQEHCEDENVIRCGYCGEFTDMDCPDWRDVVCDSCGQLVGG